MRRRRLTKKRIFQKDKIDPTDEQPTSYDGLKTNPSLRFEPQKHECLYADVVKAVIVDADPEPK